jgi:predicted DNA-binding transcriptional regulator YafY
VATARRDLEALSGAGIPVYPQAGRGGGWPLLGGARTDLSGLTAGEAKALFVLLGPSAGVVPERPLGAAQAGAGAAWPGSAPSWSTAMAPEWSRADAPAR